VSGLVAVVSALLVSGRGTARGLIDVSQHTSKRFSSSVQKPQQQQQRAIHSFS